MSAHCQRQTGFTLIEVMVALVIVTLGLASVLAITTRTMDNAFTFRERAFALYVGMNVLTELRLSGEFPEVGERNDNLDFGTREWVWTATISDTGIETLRRVEIAVALRDEPDLAIRTVTGFVGEPKQPNTPNQAWSTSIGVVQ